MSSFSPRFSPLVSTRITSSIEIAAADDDDNDERDTIEDDFDLDETDNEREETSRMNTMDRYGLKRNGQNDNRLGAKKRVARKAQLAKPERVRTFLADYSDSESDEEISFKKN